MVKKIVYLFVIMLTTFLVVSCTTGGGTTPQTDENEVKVSLEIDKSEISAIKITAVYIALSGKAAWSDVNDVSKYMENLVGVRVYVTRK